MFKHLTLVFALLILTHCFAFCVGAYTFPKDVLSSYSTSGNLGDMVVTHHKSQNGSMYLLGHFRKSINIGSNITLTHPSEAGDECNIFVVRIQMKTNAVLWFTTYALETCHPIMYGLEISPMEYYNGRSQFVAFTFNTGYPCCGMIVTGGAAGVILDITTGKKIYGGQFGIYFTTFTSIGIDTFSQRVSFGGHSRVESGWGYKPIHDDTSGGIVNNAFFAQFKVQSTDSSVNYEFLIQSIDTTTGADGLRLVPSINSVIYNNQSVWLISGTYPGPSTTWKDNSGKTHTVVGGGNGGGYGMLITMNGVILSSFPLGYNTYILSRSSSIIACGPNTFGKQILSTSIIICQSYLLSDLSRPTRTTLVSNFINSCTKTSITQIVGDETTFFILGTFENCTSSLPPPEVNGANIRNGIFVQSIDNNFRDNPWFISMLADTVSHPTISYSENITSLSVTFTKTKDFTGTTQYVSPFKNVLVQLMDATPRPQTCFSIMYNNRSSVCSGHGECTSYNYCACKYGWVGDDCSQHTCYGAQGNVNCGYGQCVGVDSCQCSAHYYGQHCNVTTCFDIESKSRNVCNGVGTCIAFNNCKCNTGYSGHQCSIVSCNGITSDRISTCSGHGQCIAPDTCKCENGYSGEDCEITSCFNSLSNDPKVCSKQGKCTSPNMCTCDTGYTGENCQFPVCFNFSSSSHFVCNGGNGTCFLPNKCECLKNSDSLPTYVGENCEHPLCYGVSLISVQKKVCSGNGICVKNDVCECNEGYTGDNCNILVDHYLPIKIAIPVGSVVLFLFFIILLISSIYCYKTKRWNTRMKMEEELEKKLLEYEFELEDIKKTSSNNQSYIIPISELEVLKKIGSGGFGSVYQAKWKEAIVAVKTMSNTDDDDNEQFEQEAMLLNSLKHPNVIQFYGVCISENNKYMVMEYSKGGSLDRFISEIKIGRRKSSLTEKIRILFHVANGISYLHTLTPKAIIHRDLKPANILLDENLQPKVCDFGLSKLMGNNSTSAMTRNLGTIFYMSPESIGEGNGSISNKVDVYSFAIIMWELFFEENPYLNKSKKIYRFRRSENDQNNNGEQSSFNIPFKVLNGFRPLIPFLSREELKMWVEEFMEKRNDSSAQMLIEVIEGFIELMKNCWKQNPVERPDFIVISKKLLELLGKCGTYHEKYFGE